MSYTQVLTEYLLYQFPRWGRCKLRYAPRDRTLSVYCLWPEYRKILLKEAERMAQLDIGIARVIIAVPSFRDMVFECQSTRDRRAF